MPPRELPSVICTACMYYTRLVQPGASSLHIKRRAALRFMFQMLHKTTAFVAHCAALAGSAQPAQLTTATTHRCGCTYITHVGDLNALYECAALEQYIAQATIDGAS